MAQNGNEAKLNRAPSMDSLMQAVFGAVSLPEVEFGRNARVHENLSAALAHMDEQLAKERSESYASSSSTILSPVADNVAHNVVKEAFEVHDENHMSSELGQEHQSSDEKSSSRQSVYSPSSAASVKTLTDNEMSLGDYEETESRFGEPAHLPIIISKVEGDFRINDFGTTGDLYRGRSLTLDSTVSTATSRFGNFEVHDAYGQPEKFNIPPPETHKEKEARKLALLEKQYEQAAEHVHQLQIKIKETVTMSLGHPVPHVSHEEMPKQNGRALHEYELGSEKITFINQYESKKDSEEIVGVSPVAQEVLQSAVEVGVVGGKKMLVPEMRESTGYRHNPLIRKVIIGGDQEATTDDKTVLFFGTVGSGKTSLINSMLNYLYDVKRENSFRFVVAKHVDPSAGLTAYTFKNTILPYTVTVVDTPGVANIEGNTRVSGLIQEWFNQELIAAGRFRLDAITIVLKQDEKRIEWPFIDELSIVKKMFGDDLKTNVLPIITHAEVLPQPIAIRSISQANINFMQYYKVNNSGFFPEPLAGITKLKHFLYYKHGVASLEAFFKGLQECIHPLLAVLRKSRSLSSSSTYADGLY